LKQGKGSKAETKTKRVFFLLDKRRIFRIIVDIQSVGFLLLEIRNFCLNFLFSTIEPYQKCRKKA